MPSLIKLEGLPYALFSRFARIWRSRLFLFSMGRLLGIPNVGKKITPQASDLSTANILIIRPDVLGDVLLTLPFLSELKRRLPGARITLAVDGSWKKFIEHLSIVDAVMEYPLSSNRWCAITNIVRAVVLGRGTLKKLRFNMAACPRWDADFHDAHLVAFFSHTPQRVGYFEKATPWKEASNRGRDAFYTHVIKGKGVRHEVDRSLHLLEELGLETSPSESEFRSFSIRNKVVPVDLKLNPSWKGFPLIGIFPGVQDPVKQWPVEKFIAAARKIMVCHPVRFLVFGTQKESVSCDHFSRELSGFALNLCGNTDLTELAGSLRHCATVVSCDSGGAHLAGMMEVPVVVIFRHPLGEDPSSPLSPDRFHPLGRFVRVLRPGADNSPVDAGQVAESVLTFISQKMTERIPC